MGVIKCSPQSFSQENTSSVEENTSSFEENTSTYFHFLEFLGVDFEAIFESFQLKLTTFLSFFQVFYPQYTDFLTER